MATGTVPQRVALLELGGRSALLTRLLDSVAFELVRADSMADLTASGSVCGLVSADQESLAALVAEILARPAAPPLLILVGRPDTEHLLLKVFAAALQGKREWQATFDAIVDPVAILDIGGTIVRANVGFAALARRGVREIVGLACRDLLGPALDSSDPVASTLADGEARTVEARFAGVPGTQLVTTSPLRDADGRLIGLVMLLKDLTESKEEAERMRQAARLADIGRLAGGVAHEINTPLASMALRTERLLRSAQDARLQAIDSFRDFPRYLKTIEQEIFRCKKIIGSLLDFSRSRPPELRLTDVNELTRRAVDLVRHQLSLKQVEVTLELEEDLPQLRADEDQLRQAFLALLMNAYDATPAGGHVRVSSAREREGFLRVSVADEGDGIPPEHHDKLFSPFFTTKPTGQGTGLGLAVCHGVVAAHGGEIRVDSQPGAGTRVSLILPLAGPARAAAPGTHP